jgi:hypothetical protein
VESVLKQLATAAEVLPHPAAAAVSRQQQWQAVCSTQLNPKMVFVNTTKPLERLLGSFAKHILGATCSAGHLYYPALHTDVYYTARQNLAQTNKHALHFPLLAFFQNTCATLSSNIQMYIGYC